MNAVQLIGNIATEITLRLTKTNKQIAHFNLAVDAAKETYFIPITCWDSVAVNVSQYCQKGSRLAIEGTLRMENWSTDEKKYSRLIVVARRIDFLSPKTDQENESSDDLEETAENIMNADA